MVINFNQMKQALKILGTALILFIANSLSAHVITGKVSDLNGQPLPGVSVMEKGTTTGSITNLDGDYSITIKNEHSVLVFSYIGYLTRELAVKGRTIIDISLEADLVEMDEVVVAGYGAQKKSLFASGVRYERHKAACASPVYFEANVPQHNTEGYSAISENGFNKVSLNPLSTFSIDVDAASYSNMRRYINSGSLPPSGAVRIEEMINYFNYEYPQPEKEQPFSINTELSFCPWNSDNYLLHVGLQGRTISRDELPPSNIVFLLDVSGSMSAHNKLPLLKSSLQLLVKQLSPQDRVAIVVYAGSSGLVLESTPGNQKQTIIEAMNRLNAGGSTAGGAGLKLAYKVASENFIEEGNNRIILATDGDFNVGQSSNADMEELIVREREKGIAISVLGFGMGNYKDDKMEIIADKGNGNYAYIDNLQEAKKVLVSEFGGTLFTIAKDVKFQLEFNPKHVKEYRLVGYENRLLNEEDFEDDKKDAGEMGAGHTVTALYEIVPASKATKTGPLKYQHSQLSDEAMNSNELVTLKLRYKEPDGYKSSLLEQVVMNAPIQSSKTSDNFRFSASVAQFGMLLRDSEFKGTSNWESTLSLAKSSKGTDEEGYRNEMIGLVKSAQLLETGTANK